MSLTGKSATIHILAGVSFTCPQVQRLLMDNFILPFHRQEWTAIKHNSFMIPSLRKQIRKHPSLLPYLDFLQALTWVHYDQTITGNTMVYRTRPIQILPEYEVYHTFYGKPSVYDNDKLELIRTLLKDPSMNYDQLKLFL